MEDIKNGAGGDIDICTGDFTYIEPTQQHQQDIILADKGHYKYTPTTGVGIANFISETDPETLLRTIRKELAKDGMKVSEVSIRSGELVIKARYL